MLHAAAAVLVVLGAVAHPSGTRAPDSLPPAGDYRSRPVFFELHPEMTRVEGDELDLLRRGLLRLQHYDPVDVTRYAWERETFTEYTWWMQTQELRFLVPAIASRKPADRRLALEWFMRWYAVHMVPEPATTAWGEPMSAAYRAMVLVYMLKTEERRRDRDEAVVECIRATVRAHQRWLADPANFDPRSNHGLIDALGLFETTRVFAGPEIERTAFARLESLFEQLVSPAGVEREHSAGYHFTVMLWFEQITGYLETLATPPRGLIDRLAAGTDRMRGAGYFLQDHGGRVPPIGDTDSVHVDAYSASFRVDEPPGGATALFDPLAGYAAHKGARSTGDCRHVVFRVPGNVDARSHCHADALALYFSHAGETILGDGGRYSYSSDPVRAFVTSPAAHSTIVPYPPQDGMNTNAGIVRDVADLSTGNAISWRASYSVSAGHYVRTVRVDPGDRGVTVVDSVASVRASAGTVDAAQLWQLGTDVVEVREAESRGPAEVAWLLTTARGQRVRLTVNAGRAAELPMVSAEVVRGRRDPESGMLGWYSPAQKTLHPATTLLVRLRGASPVVATTRIEVERGSCEPGKNRSRRRR